MTKKFAMKVLMAVLALTLVSGLTVRAENVLHEIPGSAGVAYGANSLDFARPDGVVEAAVAIVFEFEEGDESGWNAYIALGYVDGVWTQANRDDPLMTTTPGRITLDVSGVTSGLETANIRISDWWPGGYQLGVTRVLFIGEAGAVFDAPAAPAVTVNPLTGDGFGMLWFTVSGIGLAASLAALTVTVKKRKK